MSNSLDISMSNSSSFSKNQLLKTHGILGTRFSISLGFPQWLKLNSFGKAHLVNPKGPCLL